MCALSGDNAEILLALSRANIQSRFVSKFEVFPQLVDTPKHTVQGFIVNKKCQHFEAIFLRENHGVIFKNNHFWLFIDNDPNLEMIEAIVSICSFAQALKRCIVNHSDDFRHSINWNLTDLMRCQ